MSRGNALVKKTGATESHAHLLLREGPAIKGFVVCKIWDLEPFGPAKWSGSITKLVTTTLALTWFGLSIEPITLPMTPSGFDMC